MTTYYAPGLSGIGTTQRALDLVGTTYNPGWCLRFLLLEIYKVPGVASYDRHQLGGRDANAIDYWVAAKDRGQVVHVDDADGIPAGVMVVWTGGEHGHVAYSLGGGEVITTDLPIRGRVGRVDVEDVVAAWGLDPAGYIVKDGNGFTLVRTEDPAEDE